MRKQTTLFFKIAIFQIGVVLFFACNETPKTVNVKTEIKSKENATKPSLTDSLKFEKKLSENSLDSQTVISILILPSECSYDYSLMGFDFTLDLQEGLLKEKSFNVPPFPYKKLKGTSYNCVYGIPGCKRILKTMYFDFIMMSKFTSGSAISPPKHLADSSDGYWGYEIKVLNVKTMQTFIPARNTKCKNYGDLVADINNKMPIIIDKIKLSHKSSLDSL